MMMEQERSYASIILRLLLDGELAPANKGNIIWGDLLHIAAQNGVLIRVVDGLETIGLEPRHFFSAAVKEMRSRNQRKLSLISRISERCVEAHVDFVFPKAFLSYPDMTGDIDLYLANRSPNADAVILAGLHATPLKRNLRNRIDGTANYQVRGCESLLEIHHGRIGMLGEHKWFVRQIIDNSRFMRIDGDQFMVPSREDQLILQSVQRVVQRSYLRLSDIAGTVTLLRGEPLNWNYVFKTVSDLNSSYSLRCYLNLVDQVHRQTFHRSLLPPRLLKSMVRLKPAKIEFRDGFYRFRRIRMGSRGYLDKFFSAVLSENWTVATRLSLLPLLALTTLFRKLRTS